MDNIVRFKTIFNYYLGCSLTVKMDFLYEGILDISQSLEPTDMLF